MFKLAVFTDEVSQDLERVIQVCRDYELDGVELRSVWDKGPHELTDADVERLKAALADEGLEVCAIASPFFKCDLGSAEEYEEHIGILKRCVELCDAFGCATIRGFTFWRKGERWQVIDEIVEKFDRPVKILSDSRATLGIENEGSTYCGTAAEVKDFAERLGSEKVKAVWDPCNSISAGEKPHPDGYEIIRPLMVHVHIKDARKGEGEGGGTCAVGEGEVGWKEQFAALARDGYEGWCSLETHWRLEKELDRKTVNQPGGARFSAGAEGASRICLDNIREMLKAL